MCVWSCIVYKINFNMRCIEISLSLFFICNQSRINFNMRCIEIGTNKRQFKTTRKDKLQHEMYWNPSLLSFQFSRSGINFNMRCIEMLFLLSFHMLHFQINFNMRCIKIAISSRSRETCSWTNFNMSIKITHVPTLLSRNGVWLQWEKVIYMYFVKWRNVFVE